MNIDRNLMTQRILDLTLEILNLLTGEDHTVVKLSDGRDGDGSKCQTFEGYCKTQRPIVEPPPPSLIHERHNEQKILELTQQIIQLLTGEVPIRCEDVTVHLSMGEWEYVERHKELYKDVMMEDHHPVITADKSVSGEFHTPLLVTECGTKTRSENINNHGGTYTPEHRPGEYPISRIKEEEGNLSYTDFYRPTDYAPAAEESLKDYINPSEINSAESVIESREPDGSKYHKATINVELSSSVKGKVLCLDPKDLVICETNRKGGKSSDREEDFPQRSHLKHVHTGRQPPFPGTEGEERVTDNAALKTHQKVHAGKRPFKCSECGNYFTRHSSLKKHRLIHTGEKPYTCPECEKCFTQRSSLKKHQLIHTGEKPFTCPECGKCFRRASVLTSHRTIHTEEKPFTCRECGKCFRRTSDLTSHRITHRREKPHKCSDCGKSFTRPVKLASHKRLHTGEKPFKCSECGKCFTIKIYLDRHLQIHARNKTFECTECGKWFLYRSQLVKHQKIHLGDKTI